MGGAIGLHLAHKGGGRDFTVAHEDDDGQQDRGYDVEDGAGQDNQQPLPGLLVIEGPGIVEFLVLADELTEAADGESAQRIADPLMLLGNKLGPHAHRELIHPDMQQPGYAVMAELVDNHQYAEHEQRREDG